MQEAEHGGLCFLQCSFCVKQI